MQQLWGSFDFILGSFVLGLDRSEASSGEILIAGSQDL
jgi:hypothetical protein